MGSLGPEREEDEKDCARDFAHHDDRSNAAGGGAFRNGSTFFWSKHNDTQGVLVSR